MTGSQIDASETVGSIRIGKGDEAVAGPYFVARFFIRGANLRCDLPQLGGFEFASEGSVADLLVNPLPCEPLLDAIAQFAAGLSQAPYDRCGVKARDLAPIPRPLDQFTAEFALLRPGLVRIEDDQVELRNVLDVGAVFWKRTLRVERRSRAKLSLDNPFARLLDLPIVQRRAPIVDDLLEFRLEAEPVTVRARLADVERLALEGGRRVVDAGRVDLGFSKREAKLGQMRDLIA